MIQKIILAIIAGLIVTYGLGFVAIQHYYSMYTILPLTIDDSWTYISAGLYMFALCIPAFILIYLTRRQARIRLLIFAVQLIAIVLLYSTGYCSSHQCSLNPSAEHGILTFREPIANTSLPLPVSAQNPQQTDPLHILATSKKWIVVENDTTHAVLQINADLVINITYTAHSQ